MHDRVGHARSSLFPEILSGDRVIARLLSRAGQLLLPDLIVAEVVDVLESVYRVPRPRVAELVRAIVAFPAIEVADEPVLVEP